MCVFLGRHVDWTRSLGWHATSLFLALLGSSRLPTHTTSYTGLKFGDALCAPTFMRSENVFLITVFMRSGNVF